MRSPSNLFLENPEISCLSLHSRTLEAATDDRSAPEVTFELFAELPVELRLKIWKFVPAPRLVVVRFHEDRRKKTHNFSLARYRKGISHLLTST
jgi:hypothetical protein